MSIQIHGKEYQTVAERVHDAHAKEDLLAVSTEVLNQDPVVIKATVTTKKGTFTGISAANPSKSIEKVSPYEVAETSAVGRALAFAGYATTAGIASAEEVDKATAGISDVLFGKLRNAYQEKGTMTPEMQVVYEKCSIEQKKRLSDVTKDLRKAKVYAEN